MQSRKQVFPLTQSQGVLIMPQAVIT